MKQTFEDYLKDVHASSYHGVDDDMPDAFDNWLTDDLQVDDLIELAQNWGNIESTKSALQAIQTLK